MLENQINITNVQTKIMNRKQAFHKFRMAVVVKTAYGSSFDIHFFIL